MVFFIEVFLPLGYLIAGSHPEKEEGDNEINRRDY